MKTILLLIAVPVVWYLGVWLLLGPWLSSTRLSKQGRNVFWSLIWTGMCAAAGIGIALSPLFL